MTPITVLGAGIKAGDSRPNLHCSAGCMLHVQNAIASQARLQPRADSIRELHRRQGTCIKGIHSWGDELTNCAIQATRARRQARACRFQRVQRVGYNWV